eukprot:1123696-Prorocentrum_lima.AAC.1
MDSSCALSLGRASRKSCRAAISCAIAGLPSTTGFKGSSHQNSQRCMKFFWSGPHLSVSSAPPALSPAPSPSALACSPFCQKGFTIAQILPYRGVGRDTPFPLLTGPYAW